MNTKRFLAFLLASVMVVGSGLTAFASETDDTTAGTGTAVKAESTAVTGTASEEGLVVTRLYRVTLPVIPQSSLNYTVDPQGLIAATSGKKYTDLEIGEGNLFFVNHSVVQADGNGAKSGLSGSSDEFSCVNKSTFPITVTVTTKATKGSAGTNVLVPDIAASATPTGTNVYLGYKDNAKKTTAAPLTASDVEYATVLGDAKAAYKYDYKNDAYVYEFDADGTYDFATLKFGFEGKIDVTDLDDWTISAPANATTNEVRYTSIAAPTISVKYKLDEYTGEDDPDIAGPEAASSESGSSSGSGSSTTTPTSAYAAVQSINGTNMLVVTPSNGTAFNTSLTASDVTNYKLKYNSGEFVSATALVKNGLVGITYANLQTALGFTSLSTGDKITVQFTIDGTTYEAVYTR